MAEIKIEGPLIFGNKEQIEKIRLAERQTEWDSLAKCQKCDGEGYCDHCDAECEQCDGLGKEYRAIEAFKSRNPGITGFQMHSLRCK